MPYIPSIFVANARSLLFKVDDLAVTCASLAPDVVTITETWLHDKIPEGLISIPKYHTQRADRIDRTGGGVCVYIDNMLSVDRLSIQDHPDYFESVWLFLPDSLILLICAYIPPKVSTSHSNDVISFFTDTIDDFLNRGFGRFVIFTGDFNQLNVDKLCSENDIMALNNLPTRGLNTLDNVLVSDELVPFYSCSVNAPLSSSDHSTIFCTARNDQLCQTSRQPKGRHVEIFDLRSSNVQSFLRTVAGVNWRELYDMSYDIDTKCALFYKVINLCIEQSIPKVSVEMSKNGKPWITPLVKTLIDKRWSAFRTKDFEMYNRLKFKVKVAIKKAKQRWSMNAKHSPKELWRVTKALTGRSAASNELLVNSFGTAEIAADAINSVFISIFREETFASVSFGCETTTMPTIQAPLVFKCLKELKVGKACGPDAIPNVLFKKAAAFIAEPLCHIYNLCLSAGEFPSCWKQAIVVPVPKSPRPAITDFRPISLLCSPCKVFEKALVRMTMPLFHRAAGPEQHGCFHLHSTATASIMIHDHITSLLDLANVKGVHVLSYDISKAFDQISHQVILSRLVDCSFPHNFVSLMAAYLTDRYQRVRIDNHLSGSARVPSGVPQGSVIGPLLFSAVMGLLTPVNSQTRIVKYIDDVTLVVPIFHGGQQFISDEDKNVRHWAIDVGLTINEAKSKVLQISGSTNVEHFSSLNMVDSHKILGIVWSDDLKWAKHFDSISRTFASRLYCLRVLKGVLDTNELFAVYCSLLRPLLEYCSPLFIGMNSSISKRLERLQKRAHRIICGSRCGCSRFQSIQSRREIQAKALFDKSKNPDHPLNCLLPSVSELSSRFILPLYKTLRRSSSFVPAMVLRENGFK